MEPQVSPRSLPLRKQKSLPRKKKNERIFHGRLEKEASGQCKRIPLLISTSLLFFVTLRQAMYRTCSGPTLIEHPLIP